jgi:hypothetical protein
MFPFGGRESWFGASGEGDTRKSISSCHQSIDPSPKNDAGNYE